MSAKEFLKAVSELEDIIAKLRQTDISIDDAIRLHEEGLVKYGSCVKILEQAQQKVEIYKKETGELHEYNREKL